MVSDIQAPIQRYFEWLKEKTAWDKVGDWFEITTPHLDRHNDYIQIYAKKQKNRWVLSDGGSTLTDLIQSGCIIDNSPKRQEIFTTILNGFGIEKLQDKTLVTYAEEDTFPIQKHNLIQAILAVSDMFYLSQTTVKSVFLEDVGQWLDKKEIRFSANLKITGQSRYDHLFHFLIPKSKNAPERIIQTINTPTKDSALTFIVAWVDTQKTRPKGATAIAFLNDNNSTVSASVKNSLRSYDITPVLWTDKEEVYAQLAC